MLLSLFGVCCYSWGYAPVDVAWLLAGVLLLDLLLFELSGSYDAHNGIIKLRTYYLIDLNGVGIFGFEF